MINQSERTSAMVPGVFSGDVYLSGITLCSHVCGRLRQ